MNENEMDAISKDLKDNSFAKVVGDRLRTLRKRKRLSLQAVEEQSGGTLRAAVVGSYERGDRTVSVLRLAELAEFYGVPVDSLVRRDRDDSHASSPNDGGKVVLDLNALHAAPPEAEQLVNFVAGVQHKRNDFGSEVLTIRGNDVWMVSTVYGISPAELREKMQAWGVIAERE
jgi:transcriptional regulator with XRE-family HTH domain